jgi:3-hydroxyacyl-CoA dehydrogenase
LGIVDRVVEGDLVTEAVYFTRGVADPPRRTRDLQVTFDPTDAAGLAAVREQVRKRTPQLLAPIKAIDAVEAAARLPFADGLRFEATLFQECLLSEQSKGLIHVFFSEREAGKVPGPARDTPTLPIRRAAVVGAGTLGGGIAMTYANAGIPVTLRDVSQDALDRGMAAIQKAFAATVGKGRVSRAEADRRVGLIRPTLSFDGFEDADVSVEAVFEKLDLKKEVFAELENVARPDAILATTTSTLDVDAIAAATARPQQVIGHHFFSPANSMRLLEIVRGKQTSPTVVATSLALAKTLGKLGVLVGNRPGFVGNRLFVPYLREARLLLEEGATVEAVDAALIEFGMTTGPFAVPTDPAVKQEIETTARPTGGRRRTVSTDEMVERPIFALINEGAKVLEEGIALRAADVDVICIHGYGFPPHRGGPMWYADAVGLPKVLERVRQFEREYHTAWKPAELLRRLAAEGKTFADYGRERAG